MKGYKAFKKGMICRGKQYQENTVFEEDKAEICNSGMHFCKKPLDVLEYYPLVDENGDVSEFAEVEALDECRTDDNKKFCTKKLKIGAKISFPQIVQASVELDYSNTQTRTLSDSSGDSARIGSSGYSAQIGSSGNFARIGSSGNFARIGSSGEYSVICCSGHGSHVKAKKGSWITLSEWKYDAKKDKNIPVCVRSVQVDGAKIKEDTFYCLKNGEFVECED